MPSCTYVFDTKNLIKEDFYELMKAKNSGSKRLGICAFKKRKRG